MAGTLAQYEAIAAALRGCDRVNGYSEQGISTTTTVDVFGNSIAPGQQIIDFFDAENNYLNSCLKSAPDGSASQGIAVADTVDINGNPIPLGTPVIHFYDPTGAYVNSCAKNGSADGFSRVGVADASTVMDNGCTVKEGTKVLDYFDFTSTYQYSVYYPEQDIHVEARILPGEDAGAVINAAIDCLPDVEEAQWREDCTWTVDFRSCGFECKLPLQTPINPTPLKQFHLKGTGEHGISLVNETGQADGIIVDGLAVGQNAHFSDFTLEGANLVMQGPVRGKTSVQSVQFLDSPDGAITLRESGNQGPVGVRLEDNHFVGCKHAYVIDATTYLLVEINGGRIWECTDSSILVNASVGVLIDNVDFTASDGLAYIHLLGDSGPVTLVEMSRCRFGGEATPRVGLPTVADILYGTATGASANPISKTTIFNNDFNGSDVTNNVPGTIPHAIAFNERPREVLVDNQNRFERAYGVSMIGEAWTGGLNPQQVGGGFRQLRNHWGENVIQSAGLAIPVFENGGVGWEMPRIDHNFTTPPGESTIRMASANGQHYLMTIDNSGVPQVVPTGYV